MLYSKTGVADKGTRMRQGTVGTTVGLHGKMQTDSLRARSWKFAWPGHCELNTHH